MSTNTQSKRLLTLSALCLTGLLAMSCDEVIVQKHRVTFQVDSCLSMGEERSCFDTLASEAATGEGRAENACLVIKTIADAESEAASDRFGSIAARRVNFSGGELSLIDAAQGFQFGPGTTLSIDLYFYAAETSEGRPTCVDSDVVELACDQPWCALSMHQPEVTILANQTTVIRFRDERGVCILEGPGCAELTCDDGAQNGAETGVDCGGTCRDFRRCGVGEGCVSTDDCDNTLCSEGLCQAPTCEDGIQNSDEAGIDCGGLLSSCAPCTTDATTPDLVGCLFDADCDTGLCSRTPTHFDTRDGAQAPVFPEEERRGVLPGFCVPDYEEEGEKDGLVGDADNCPFDENPNQEDLDRDEIGDACDDDIDGDGIINLNDNCPRTLAETLPLGVDVTDQTNSDPEQDDLGDICDPDLDGDGFENDADNCPNIPNDQTNSDGEQDDGGDACDDDDDNDGLLDSEEDRNDNGLLDVGETDPLNPDTDSDSVHDQDDVCPLVPDMNQEDHNGDGEGDACETGTPIAQDDRFEGGEDALIVGVVTENDFDPDGDPLRAILVSDLDSSTGALELRRNGVFIFTPAPNFFGDTTFSYKLSDGNAESRVAQVTIAVVTVNDPPVATPDLFETDEDTLFNSEEAGLELTANDFDIEGDDLSVILVDDVEHGELTFTGNDFTYLPELNYAGADSFSYRASDGVSESNLVVVEITVNSVNDAPVATFDTEQRVVEDEVIFGQLTATDADLGDALTYADLTGGLEGLTITATGNFSLDASDPRYQALGEAEELNEEVTYSVTDSAGASDNGRFNVVVTGVNDAPIATFVTPQVVTEDAAPLTVALTASDVDANDTLTFSLVQTPAGASLSGATFELDPSDPAYQPLSRDASQTLTVNYVVTDSQGAQDQGAFDVTVSGANDAPIAAGDTYNTSEDTRATLNAGGGVLSNDADIDQDQLSAELVTTTANGDLAFNADGSFSYLPNLDFVGIDTFTYRALDGAASSAETTVTINIGGANDPPVATFSDPQDTTEDGAPITGELTAIDPDEGDLVTFRVDELPAGFTLNDATWTFDPSDAAYQSLADGEEGEVEVEYIAEDSFNASDTAQFIITVTGVNDTPVATYDAALNATEDGEPISDALTADDVDNGDTLSFQLNAPIPAGVSLNNTTWTFNPTAAAYQPLKAGEDQAVTVRYTVTDSIGASDANGAFTVTVTGANDAPNSTPNLYATGEETELVVNALNGVLSDDTDLDGDDITAQLETDVEHGVLVLDPDGAFTYTPEANFVGADSFSYRANDGAASSAISVVTLNVSNDNDPPVATFNTDQEVTEDSGVFNVTLTATDADVGDTLTFSLNAPIPDGVTLAGSTLSINTADAAYQVLARDATREVTVSYSVTDAIGAFDTASFKVTITGVNDAPVATFNTDQEATEGGAILNGQLTSDDIDEGDNVVYINTSPIAVPGLTINADGSFSLDVTDPAYDTLNPENNATYQVAYLVRDSANATDTNSFEIKINGANDAPVLNPVDAQSVLEDAAPLTSTLSAVDPDAGETLIFTLDQAIDGFSLVGATWTFDPSHPSYQDLDAGDTLEVTAQYTVTDSRGASDSSSFVITVTGVNDVPIATFDTQLDVTEGGGVTSGLLTATDVDADDTQRFEESGGGVAGLTINADGTFDFDASDVAYDSISVGDTQTLSISYTVIDSQEASDEGSFDIVITGSNDNPVATFTAPQAATEDGAILSDNFTATDVDADDTLTFSLDVVVAGLSVSGAQNQIWNFNPSDAVYQPLAEGDTQDVDVDYTVDDGNGGTDSASFVITVTGANDAPVATFVENQNVAVGTGDLKGELTATDIDSGDSQTYQDLTGGVAGLTIEPNGKFTFDSDDPAYDALGAGESQTINVTYRVTDSQGASDDGAFDIIVGGENEPPVATFTAPQAATEDGVVISGDLTATDPDATDTLTFSLDAPIAGLALSGAQSQTWTFDPSDSAYQALAEGETQTVDVDYTVEDNNGGADSERFVITVTGVNDAPIATFNTQVSVTEGTGNQSDQLTSTDVDAGATATYEEVGATAGLTVNANGSFSFDTNDVTYDSLDDGDTQTINVTYRVTDDEGATAEGTFNIVVTGANDAPVLDATADEAATEDGAALNGTFTASDTDADDTLTFSADALDGFDLTGADWTFDPSDAAYQDLAEGATRDVTVNYSVTDNLGLSDNQSFVITVTGVNDAPTADFTTQQDVLEGASVSDQLTSTDVDAGATATYEEVGVTAGLTINADGSFTFDAADAAYDSLDDGDTQTINVTYRVTDDEGATAEGTFDIVVTGANDAPVLDATADEATTEDGAALNGTFTASDTDADDTLTFSADALDGFDLTGADWTFDPSDAAYQDLAEGATRDVTVNYSVTDNLGLSDNQSFVITVTGVNDAPTADFTTQQDVLEGASVSDQLTSTDVDAGATATYEEVGVTAGLTINADGSFTFDAADAAYDSLDDGDTQTINVTYRVTDDEGATAEGTFDIVVTGANDAPVLDATADEATTEDGAALNGTFTASDTDADDTLTFSADALDGFDLTGADWTFDPSDAAYQDLAEGATRDVTVNYSVTDNLGLSDNQSFLITVTGVNDAPTADFTTQQDVLEGASVSDQLTSTDVDAGATATYEEVGATAGLTINADGSFTFDAADAAYDSLDDGDTQTINVTYRVTDDEGATAEGTFDIVVTGANDAPVLDATADDATTEDGAALNGTFTASDADADDTLTFSADALDGFDLTGADWTFDPSDAAYQDLAEGATRDVTVNYSVTDNLGLSDNQSFLITVTGVNDAPTADFTTQQDVLEGASVSDQLTSTDVDAGATATYEEVGATAGLTINADGSFTFDAADAAYDSLDDGDTQTINVTYRVTDDEGATAEGTFDIVVTGANDAPVLDATADDAATEDGAALNGTFSASDADADDTLTFSADALDGFDLTGADWTFDPSDAAYQDLAEGATLDVTVNYSVTDNLGLSDSQSFVITVTGVNDAPVSTADAYVMSKNSTLNVDEVTGLLSNDSDVDGDNLSVVTPENIIAAQGVLAVNANGSFTYTPPNGWTGVETLSYQATDLTATTAPTSFTITVE